MLSLFLLIFITDFLSSELKSEGALKKEKKISKKNMSIDKTATVTEVKDEPVDVKVEPPAEPRPKRGKKVINCCIPVTTPQPSTSKETDFLIDKDQELDMVSQITQILLNHDFKNRKGSRDISKLIGTVRQIVATGDLSKLPPGDEMAASIAQVLLRKQPQPAPTLTLTDVRSLSIPKVSQPKTKQPKIIAEEQQPLESNIETTPTRSATGKRRRKAAVTAEQKLDSISSDIVIDLNDDDWRADSDDSLLQPTSKRQATKTPEKPKYKPGPKSKKKITRPIEEPVVETDVEANVEPIEEPIEEPFIEPVPEPVQETIAEEESILLSDDEILPEVRPEKTVKEEKAGNNKASSNTSDSDGAERYPLHPSLLTNQNFVKIVAHTYLAGNPMLDEDAATLAAQYSTGKALREFQATGVRIDSGPIYDIAVKVSQIQQLCTTYYKIPRKKSN